jgi:gluconate 2-dehydrogenase gamma chain
MSKQDESRRAFLVGAATSAGAAAAAVALVSDAHAQNQDQPAPGVQALPAGAKHGAFLNDEEAATVAAFAERIMPGTPGKPGARNANVPNYIDLALAGAYADLQEFYRRGLAALDAHSHKTYNQSFAQLTPARQDEVIAALEDGKAPSFTWPSARNFFETMRTHTMEGMFADPIYGGNKDFAGWNLVGFPGVQLTFTQADLQSKQAFSRAPMTGLQAKAKAPARRT